MTDLALTHAEQRRLLAWADLGSNRLEQVYNAVVQLLARPQVAVDHLAIAQAIVDRLTGENGHIMTDGDVSRFADAIADIVWVRYQQYLEGQDA